MFYHASDLEFIRVYYTLIGDFTVHIIIGSGEHSMCESLDTQVKCCFEVLVITNIMLQSEFYLWIFSHKLTVYLVRGFIL